MGMSKHRKSGNAGKSPKLRHHLKLMAERGERKSKEYKMYSSMRDLMSDK